MIKESLVSIYEKHYKPLLFVSFLLLLICVAFLGYQYSTKGEFISKGVSLKGGITITIPVEKEYDILYLQDRLKQKFSNADINVRSITTKGALSSIIIEASDVGEEELISRLAELTNIGREKYSVELIGSNLGKTFFRQIIRAVILAFIAMAVVVFVTFKKLIPSLFVVLATFSEIVSTLAVISFLGNKLSTAGIAALLMIIGYSVDTNILLTNRVLKRTEGSVFERTLGAFKTGLTMSLTALSAVVIGYFFTDSDVIKNIMLILMLGLLFDIPYTWIQNAGILRWYLEKKHGQT